MDLESDDDIFRAKFKFLGTPQVTLPVHWTYQQYGIFISSAVVFVGGGTALSRNPYLIGIEVVVAYLVARMIWTRITPDRGAIQVIRTAIRGLLLALRQIVRRRDRDQGVRLSTKHIRITRGTS